MSTPRLNRLAAVLVAAAIATGPALASAAPAELRTSTTSVPKGAARNRYVQGKTSYEAGQYEQAGDAWVELMGQVPESPKNRGLRAGLVLDAISAYSAAYEETGDITHLETALDHYYRYFTAYRDTYNSPNIPRPVVDARFALKDAIAAAKTGGNASSSSDSGGSARSEAESSDSGSSPAAGATSQENENEGAPPPDRGAKPATVSRSISSKDAPRSPGTPLIATGAAFVALGAGASSMIAVGAIEGQRAREDQKLPGYDDDQRARIDKRGKTMNAVLIAGAVLTPVFIGAGAALIAVGVKKNRNSRLQAVAPAVGPNFAGVTIQGRF